MSVDVRCLRCGRNVPEKDIHSGHHVCSEEALAERNEELEARVEELEKRMLAVEGALGIEGA